MTETTPQQIHPNSTEAYRAGRLAYPNGEKNPPEWWPQRQRQIYEEGWWRAEWQATWRNTYG